MITPITFKKPRFKFTASNLNHKPHHPVTPHLLRGPSRQRLDFIGCDQMAPATSAGGQCGGVYWFYLEFVDLSHNSLSVIGVELRTCPESFLTPDFSMFLGLFLKFTPNKKIPPPPPSPPHKGRGSTSESGLPPSPVVGEGWGEG